MGTGAMNSGPDAASEFLHLPRKTGYSLGTAFKSGVRGVWGHGGESLPWPSCHFWPRPSTHHSLRSLMHTSVLAFLLWGLFLSNCTAPAPGAAWVLILPVNKYLLSTYSAWALCSLLRIQK